ncbi:MAG: carboxylesterase family protein [Terricaulis sp.]
MTNSIGGWAMWACLALQRRKQRTDSLQRRRMVSNASTRRGAIAGALASAAVLSAGRAGGVEASPEVQVAQGRLRGFVRNGASIFMGVPYGADTSGAQRFLPPGTAPVWSGVRDATRPGQRAPQFVGPRPPEPFLTYFAGGRQAELDAQPEPMGEDCLVLNVLTPASDRHGRPVLFYIHGGGFTTGSGRTMTLGDKFVVEEDVVLVTVNHRLGALGYMYLGALSERYAHANPGMLDLVAALKWVRDNIAVFGGDPDKVTIYGESGGGVKVGLLMAMPQAQGLFRAAIIESGLFPAPWSTERGSQDTRAFMQRAGVADLESLQALPYDRLVGSGLPGGFPVADGQTLQADPWAAAPATAAGAPLIIGHCKDELTLFALGDPAQFSVDWDGAAAKLVQLTGLSGAALAPVIAAYRAAFPADTAPDALFRIGGDATFGRAMVAMATRKSAQAPPVYFYRMEFDTGIPPGLRALHTAELPMTVGLNARPQAANLCAQIYRSWAAFARHRDPNHHGLPGWRRFDASDRACMIFDERSRAGSDPQASPRDVLFAALAEKPFWNPL